MNTLDACRLFAQIKNMEQMPKAIEPCLEPHACWFGKHFSVQGCVGIYHHLAYNARLAQAKRLNHVELIAGCCSRQADRVDGTVSVRTQALMRLETSTTFALSPGALDRPD